MSVVFYKFKAARDFDTCTFDGPAISAFDLKREILVAKKLTPKAQDFDLALFAAQTGEEYYDDNQLIPRNSSVLVSRKPVPRNNPRLSAARYLAASAGPLSIHGSRVAPSADAMLQIKQQQLASLGAAAAGGSSTASGAQSTSSATGTITAQSSTAPLAPTTQSSTAPLEVAQQTPPPPPVLAASSSGSPPQTQPENEADNISNFFKLSANQWVATQEQMASHRPVPFRSMAPRPRPPPQADGSQPAQQPQQGAGFQQLPPGAMADNRPPPPNYVCYRCKQRGHYIWACPTLGDSNYDNQPKLRRTTGIPRTFLKTIDPSKPAETSSTSTGDATGTTNTDKVGATTGDDANATGQADSGGVLGAASSSAGDMGSAALSKREGLMVTDSGDIVIVQPNESAWSKASERIRNYLSAEDAYALAPLLPDLTCKLGNHLLREAVMTPCCAARCCDECARTSLLESEDPTLQLHCPICREPLTPDALIPDLAIRSRVDHHIRNFVLSRNKPEKSTSTEQSAPKQRGRKPSADLKEILEDSEGNNTRASSPDTNVKTSKPSEKEVPMEESSLEQDEKPGLPIPSGDHAWIARGGAEFLKKLSTTTDIKTVQQCDTPGFIDDKKMTTTNSQRRVIRSGKKHRIYRVTLGFNPLNPSR